jgi:hypothetical protein
VPGEPSASRYPPPSDFPVPDVEGVNGRSNPECSAEVAKDNEQDAPPQKTMEAEEEIEGRPPERGKKRKREKRTAKKVSNDAPKRIPLRCTFSPRVKNNG